MLPMLRFIALRHIAIALDLSWPCPMTLKIQDSSFGSSGTTASSAASTDCVCSVKLFKSALIAGKLPTLGAPLSVVPEGLELCVALAADLRAEPLYVRVVEAGRGI